jgi:hypothetical protein
VSSRTTSLRKHAPRQTGTGEGPVYTTGASFRARAEARQREVRAHDLKVRWKRLGHFLDDRAVVDGANFVIPVAHEAAMRRRGEGKGVSTRTFDNMLASQAMCFNLFAPLQRDLELATRVLRRIVPDLTDVTKLEFEYTPSRDVFNDQSRFGGVDCDLLIEARLTSGERAVIAVETKFVEREFSICGFRKPGRSKHGKPVCPPDAHLSTDRRECLYKYLYWQRSDDHRTIAMTGDARTCPFGGPLWQLWVNHTLAHEEARRRGATRARFLVCAPKANDALRADRVLDRFKALLRDPSTFVELPVDDLLASIAAEADTAELRQWSRRLDRRYGGI